ncbi:MAG: 4Fe-4S cluster-binding domain-containing protein [Ruminococcaceae bacterium]|nr:4Fe-4S cluster-binding domain-containing protein [Oscillospiraceae bacterium]
MSACDLCPRQCGADRANGEAGLCHVGDTILIASAAPHHFEEPPISGTKGSGTIFFAGCSLSCLYCQNQAISRGAVGRAVDEDGLARMMLSLADTGVHNLNLVTATHYTDRVARVLTHIKPQLKIPVVWNSSGYERPETLRLLEGLIDIYLPDFKYVSPTLSAAYSNAPDYCRYATAAIAEMYRQVGPVSFDKDGILQRGLVVRHLVLPDCREDSMAVLKTLSDTVPTEHVRLSLLRQYTPDFAPRSAPKNLLRRVTTYEYEQVLKRALSLAFDGFKQQKGAATVDYTPDFDV